MLLLELNIYRTDHCYSSFIWTCRLQALDRCLSQLMDRGRPRQKHRRIWTKTERTCWRGFCEKTTELQPRDWALNLYDFPPTHETIIWHESFDWPPRVLPFSQQKKVLRIPRTEGVHTFQLKFWSLISFSTASCCSERESWSTLPMLASSTASCKK